MSLNIFQDWHANKGNFKGRLVLLLFRIAFAIKHKKLLLVFFFWYLVIYRFFVEWILSIEINWNVAIGKGLKLYHGQALTIFAKTIIGSNCTLRHSTTIGNKELKDGSFTRGPIIGDNVNIGAHVCVIGDINIGDNVIIGAGAIVTKDIPSDCVVVGNPARIIKSQTEKV